MNISLEAIGSEPFTTATAKTWLRLDTSDHDTEVGELITASREWFEELTGYLVEQRAVTLELDSFEANSPIYLPYGPAVSITSLKEFDEDGNKGSAIAATNYLLVRKDPPRLETLNDGWQINKAYQAIEIIYEAGGTVPKEALYLMKEYVIRLYDAAGMSFDVADLERRAERYMMNPLGIVR